MVRRHRRLSDGPWTWSIRDPVPIGTQATKADRISVVPGLDEAQDVDRTIPANLKKIVEFIAE